MSFGRNPFAAKAEAAELKAGEARDAIARAQAWREAARLWDRAAEREKDDKRKRAYTARAELARARAEDASSAPKPAEGKAPKASPSAPSETQQDVAKPRAWTWAGKKPSLPN